MKSKKDNGVFEAIRMAAMSHHLLTAGTILLPWLAAAALHGEEQCSLNGSEQDAMPWHLALAAADALDGEVLASCTRARRWRTVWIPSSAPAAPAWPVSLVVRPSASAQERHCQKERWSPPAPGADQHGGWTTRSLRWSHTRIPAIAE